MCEPPAGAMEDTLYYWCDRYVRSTNYAEEHPDTHDGDELDYCRDNILRHLKDD